jgi:tyrosine-specific transport protein
MLLISGVCVGASLLAMPVLVAKLGFILSLILLLASCVLMVYTGLLTLEINLWLPPGANFVAMVERTLNKPIAYITGGMYLVYLYATLCCLYTSGSILLTLSFTHGIHHVLPFWCGSLVWLLMLSGIVWIGLKRSDYINRIVMLTLLVIFALFIIFILPHLKPSLLAGGHISALPHAIPIMLTAFTFQFLIPSLRRYLHNNFSHLRFAIIAGAGLGLVIYMLWLWIIFSIIPSTGTDSFNDIIHARFHLTRLMEVLQALVNHMGVLLLLRLFALCALATTSISIAGSLVDFWADTLGMVKTKSSRLKLLAMVTIPPFLWALIYSETFLHLLIYIGVLATILYAILPVIMVWSGRYVKELSFGQQIKGGRTALVLGLFISCGLLYLQLTHF